MITLGKDFDYIRDEMDLPRLISLNAYQENNPPVSRTMHKVCLMLESFFGINNDNDEEEPLDILEALKQFPQG